MKPLQRVSSFALASSLCAASALAVQTEAPPLSQVQVRALASNANSQPRVDYDTPSDGALWARAESYKASFAASGATYYPRFSPCQPRHYPHALSPASAAIGGAELAFDRFATPERDGDRITLDRGAFVERYDLTPSSVEQQFVFESLPARGELVLRIETSSELDRGENAQALEFRHALGRMSYGRAVTVDAAGHRAPAQTRFVGSAIEIHVDAQVVANASLPLVIDPVVTTFPVNDHLIADDLNADCVYDAFYQRWLVVYQHQYITVDFDVAYRIYDTLGTLVGQGYIDQTTTNWQEPSCADLGGWHNFLAVAAVGPVGQQTVRARAISAGTFFMTADYLASVPGHNNVSHPVIGGDPYSGLMELGCLVYQNLWSTTSSQIIASYLDGDGTQANISPVYFPVPANTLDTWPSVSKSNAGSEWMLVWSREINSSVAQIWAARVSWGGWVIDGPFQVSFAGNAVADRHPVVSSAIESTNGRRRVIAFERYPGTENDIMVAAYDGSTKLVEIDLSFQEIGGSNLANQFGPSVDCDGRHFLVSYAEESTPGNYDIRATELFLSNAYLGISENRVLVASTAKNEFRPAVASMHGSNGPPENYMLVWDVGQFNGNGQRDVFGAFFDGASGGDWTSMCGTYAGACPCLNGPLSLHGCPNSANASGALLTASGHLSTVDDQATLQVTGLPPNVSCLFFQGNTSGLPVPFGDGLRCVASPLIRFPLRHADASGVMSYPSPGDTPISVVGQVPSIGAFRAYQAWYRDAANFCTSATYNVSNAVRIDWAP